MKERKKEKERDAIYNLCCDALGLAQKREERSVIYGQRQSQCTVDSTKISGAQLFSTLLFLVFITPKNNNIIFFL